MIFILLLFTHKLTDISSYKSSNSFFKTIEETQLNCLIKNAFHEAGNQGDLGMLLVTQVVYNRAENKNKNYCDVIYEYKQFSWTLFKEKHIPTETYNKIKTLILNHHYGFLKIPEEYEQSIAFHADYVKPYWRHAYEKVGVWRNHIFYKELK